MATATVTTKSALEIAREALTLEANNMARFIREGNGTEFHSGALLALRGALETIARSEIEANSRARRAR